VVDAAADMSDATGGRSDVFTPPTDAGAGVDVGFSIDVGHSMPHDAGHSTPHDAGHVAVDTGPTCSDDCADGAPARCQGTNLETCADHDRDGCRQWGVDRVCPAMCTAGACVECSSNGDCGSRQRCSNNSCVSAPQWAETQIVYPGPTTQSLDNCYFCDAHFYDGMGTALIRFQQGGGWTVWSLQLNGALRVGTVPIGRNTTNENSVHVAESDTSVGSHRGSWTSNTGSLVITSLDARTGGHITGRVTAQLEKISSPNQAGTFQAEFHAEF